MYGYFRNIWPKIIKLLIRVRLYMNILYCQCWCVSPAFYFCFNFGKCLNNTSHICFHDCIGCCFLSAKENTFFVFLTPVLRKEIKLYGDNVTGCRILKPYSFCHRQCQILNYVCLWLGQTVLSFRKYNQTLQACEETIRPRAICQRTLL